MRSRALALSVLLVAPILAVALSLVAARFVPSASAQGGTGTVTGQVVWNYQIPAVYGAPGATVPDLAPESSEVLPETTPEAAPDGEGQAVPGFGGGIQVMPAPGIPAPIRPPVPRLIPAGAVLVAVQGTSLNTRTDENGHFRIEGVPAGQFLTVAAGPVRGLATAFVLRPNVQVNAGQTVNLGRLYLGQQYWYGPVPYGAAPNAAEPQPEEVP